MSPIIAMVEGGGGACEEGGGRWGLSFFWGWGVLVRGVALLAFLRPEGREAWESVVGEGPGNCVVPLNSLFQIVGFFGALSGGGAGRGEGG